MTVEPVRALSESTAEEPLEHEVEIISAPEIIVASADKREEPLLVEPGASTLSKQIIDKEKEDKQPNAAVSEDIQRLVLTFSACHTFC